MVFKVQKISDFGTATPVVARTIVQGDNVSKFFCVSPDKREAFKGVLWELHQKLVRCYSIRTEIQNNISKAHKDFEDIGLDIQSGGRVVTIPGVPDLETKAESFLQAAKGAIRETARFFEAIYETSQDHKFHKLATWAEKQFGIDSAIVIEIRKVEPWIKSIVDMRNAVDHPANKPKEKLIITNFKLNESLPSYSLIDPSWNLLGDPPEEMIPKMDAIIKLILETSELFLILIFNELDNCIPIKIIEIPVSKRDPSMPIRLKVVPSSWPAQA